MDLLNLLVSPKDIKSVCFLCYKHSKNSTSLHEVIEIHDEFFNLNITLWNIMNSLFPTHELLLSQACEECSGLIIKMFSLLQRNCLKNVMLNSVVDNINEEIDNKVEYARQPKKYMVKIELPTCESIMTHPRKPVNNYRCKKCDMQFKSKVILQKHVRMTHRNTNKAIICDVCGKMFTKSANLQMHLNNHQEKQCPHCHKVIKSQSYYNFHLKSHTNPIKRNRKNKYHCCADCDYRSMSKNTLQAHINKVHLNIRPFVCEICRKGFYKKSNLTQHFVTHEKIKDKTCEICGDTFVNEKTLIEHLMLHSGEKPYKCGICEADFITSGRRLEHMKRKHMTKTECCVICRKRFSLKKDLKSHLKSVHGAEDYILNLGNEQTELQVIKVMQHT